MVSRLSLITCNEPRKPKPSEGQIPQFCPYSGLMVPAPKGDSAQNVISNFHDSNLSKKKTG
uniref:Uncharacterized protein n=1 Tax=Anguilla anguilla TaxID=7936 RepID=A0A0E9PRB4_ANGAN